ncbi:WhiB family transcriptional regulator [Isoptericola aurantiacus]|uniref:WhiB family transcriptional regulator n=1 Tax=Isoptericola aurantiacus TaxID=3377839 RepID=UPI00383AAD63
MSARVSQQVRQQIAMLAAQGVSDVQIGKELDRTSNNVQLIRRRYGIAAAKPAKRRGVATSALTHDESAQAACRVDVAADLTEADDAFFHPEQERGLARFEREQRAKAVCAACPIRWRCLEVALANREPYGVFGGFTPEERDGYDRVEVAA